MKFPDNTIISVTGLGYVGLPMALAFAKHFHVVGFDKSPERVAMLRRSEDPSYELSAEAFDGADISFTSDPADLAAANFHIVATPTPIDESRQPDITLLLSAMESVGKALKPGDVVVVESTVYPGCTEEDCLPVLERASGLKVDEDFGIGYSPERINPGDRKHTFASVQKIVSGRTPEVLERVAQTYSKVVLAGVFRAKSIMVAEAAKVIENTQRDVNIALMNEFSLIFSRMGICTADVIEAASTKWNFLPFFPGLVGGHCIGVDPYYLDYKAREMGYHTQIINHGRYINDSMGRYVAKQTVKRILAKGFGVIKARVLVMGLTYKPNVADVRNSRTEDIIDELRSFCVGTIDVMDPLASKRDSMQIYGFEPMDEPDGVYDAIVVATAHDAFKALGQEFFERHLRPGGTLSDVYGIFSGRVSGFDAWSL